jgi:hypothetical protein
VTSYLAFQDTFANPAYPPGPANLGFPNQKTSDRPPYLGYFRTVAPLAVHDILVAVMHAPKPGYRPATKKAANNMAVVAEFATGDTCIIMGDFNVTTNAVAAAANSYGEDAFGPLVNLAPNAFQQRLVDNPVPAPGTEVLTSLVAQQSAWVGMAVGDYFNQPYDQIFFRVNANNLTAHNDGVYDLVEDALGGNYLEPALVNLWNVITGNAIANFNNVVEDAFVAYRLCVSDHFPVVTEVHD